MKKFLALLMILSLMLSAVPAMAEVSPATSLAFRADDPNIDTIPTTITSPGSFALGKYFHIDDYYLNAVTFTAPETGTYYFYQRREDNVSPRIAIYTTQDDALVVPIKTGEAGKALVMDAYLKTGYSYRVNFTYVVTDQNYTEGKGIFIASCLPTAHMEAGGPWTVTLKPEKGKHGTEVRYCDFCHQVGWTRVIPAIPWKLRIASGSLKYNSVKIKWNSAQDATQYEIYRRKGNAEAALKLVGTTTKNNFKVTGLNMGTTYYFQVRAVTPYGKSELSEAISATPTLKAPVGFKVTSKTAGQVKLTWKERANAQGYIIYRASSAKGDYKKVKVVDGGSKTSVTLKATKGSTYYYKIAAYRKVGGKKVPATLSNYKAVTVMK